MHVCMAGYVDTKSKSLNTYQSFHLEKLSVRPFLGLSNMTVVPVDSTYSQPPLYRAFSNKVHAIDKHKAVQLW